MGFFDFLKSICKSFYAGILDSSLPKELSDLPIGLYTQFFSIDDIKKAVNKKRESFSQCFSLASGVIFNILWNHFFENTGDQLLFVKLFLGAIISSIFGEWGKYIFDKHFSHSTSEIEKKGAGLDTNDSPGDGNGPGGVELKKVDPIVGTNLPNKYLTKTINVFFESEITDSSIKKAFNSIVLPEFRGKKIQEYYETIIQEVSNSLDLNLELPFVSLHFNNNKLLYSVMPSYYRKTIIGNVFAYMDYFLKGFVNGGYFSVDFVRDWASKPPNQRITNLNILNSNLIDVKNSLKKVGKSRFYVSIGEIIDQNKYSGNYDSAFRIIGKLKSIGTINDDDAFNGIYFPKNTFKVEHDLNPKPEKQKKLETHNENEMNELGKISSKYFIMRRIISELMPEVPEFRGFFAILDMITFAYHYCISLRSIGKEIETKNAFHYKNKEYTYQIPDVFPPLPVAHRIEKILNYTSTEVIQYLRGSCLEREIRRILLGYQKDFTHDGLKELQTKLKSFFKQKLLSLFDNILYEDEELSYLPYLYDTFMNFIKEIPKEIKSNLIKQYCNLHKALSYGYLNEDNLYKLTFVEIRRRYTEMINNVLNGYNNYTYQSINYLQNELRSFSIETYDIYSCITTLIGYSMSYKKGLHIVRPTIMNEENRKEIIGGCKFSLKKDAYFHKEFKTENELNEIYSLIYDAQDKKKEYISCKNGLSGFVFKLNIVSLPYDGASLLISRFDNLAGKDFQFDESQTNFSTIKNLMIDYQKNDKNLNKDSQAYYACCCGDIFAINDLINSGVDFGKLRENGIYPFLAAMMSGNHYSIHFLLTNSLARLGDINRSTETNMTPLSWAIYYDFPDIVELLLKKNAYINIPLKSNAMSAIHLACFHDRPECLSLLIKYGKSYKESNWFFLNKTSKFIDPFDESERGITPFQNALANSPHCASILIDSKKVKNFYKTNHLHLNYRDIALMNGQYHILKKLPKMKGIIDELLSKRSIKKNISDFDQLCFALSSGDILIAESVFSNWYERFNKIQLNDKQIQRIVEHACIGGCSNFVQLLSKVFNLKEYPIALRAAHYGLVEWIPKIEKYGGELMCEKDSRTIFDEAVENSDHEFIEGAFKIVEKVPEQVIKRIVQKSIEINDVETMSSISKSLLNEKSFYYLNPSDIFIPPALIQSYIIYKDNLNPKIPIKLDQFISQISTNLLSYLLSVYPFTKDVLISAYKNAVNKNRNDNGFTILEKNPNIVNEIKGAKNRRDHKMSVYNTLNEMINDETMPEDDKINRALDLFSNIFDYGDLGFIGSSPLVNVAGISINNLWILQTLPKRCIEDFYLFNNAFREDLIELLFKKEYLILESLFGHKKAGFFFLNSLRKLNFKKLEENGNGDEFISSLLNLLNEKKLFRYYDKDNQTIFHYISKFNSISAVNMDKITEILKNLKKDDLKKIINARTRIGETVMMSFAKSGNINAIEYISKMVDNFYNRDIFGDNILHKILNGIGATNDNVFQSVAHICSKSPELIIQRNRKGENPFMVAAAGGFNGVLGLMSTYYPIKILDSFPEKSILHIASLNNRPRTISYIVQNLHVDVNIKTNAGSTPLHIAAQSSSYHAYTQLISLGGNPLIKNNKNMTALDCVFKNGSEKMIRKIMNLPSFNLKLSSPEILFHLVQNIEAYPAFIHIIGLYDDSAIHALDSSGMNLIMLACLNNNRKCVSDLLMMGCDPEKRSSFGYNSIHVCAFRDSIGCSDLILNHINQTKGSEGIKKILNEIDSNGNLPIHYAAKNGLDGFVTHLLKVCKDQDFLRENNSGRIPFAESIANNRLQTAGILAHFWTDVLNKKIDVLISKLNPELRKKWSDEFTESYDYYSGKEIVMKIKEFLWKPSKPSKIEQQKQEQNEHITRIDIFNNNLKNSGVKVPKQFLKKCSGLINNISFRVIINTLLSRNKKNVSIVNKIFDVATNMQSNIIRNIAFLIILPIMQNEDIDTFISLINNIDQLHVDESHPLFSWIENGMISIAEKNKNRKEINFQIQNLFQLISLLIKNKDLNSLVSYPVLPAPIHEVANLILNIKDEKFKKILIRFVHLMNASMLYENKSSIIIDFCNRIDGKQNILFEYLMKNEKDFEEDVFERAIFNTLELYEDPLLNDDDREIILSNCISLISIKNDEQGIKNQISAWISNSMRIIHNYGNEYFKTILTVIPSNSFSIVNEALSLILTINSPEIANKDLVKNGIVALRQTAEKEEKKRFVESRNLDEEIKAFNEGSGKFIPYKYAFDGTPVIKLKPDELESLRIFGEILEKENKIFNITDVALDRGKIFRDKPTIENAAKLVALVRQAIRETFDINPFIVQCLAVASMLLHRINKDERNELKGRIAQVATGEGKSIIVAMLSGCIGLTGSCVDVISSSPYLAMRDAEKFKPFYEKLGLKCGTVDDNNYDKGFDYHILYSTNTGFEFAFLREGISGKTMIETTLLYENVKKKRPKMAVIVDEADNLFIDTAVNSARIATGGNTKRSWIFKPIWQGVVQFMLERNRSNSSLNLNRFKQILLESATNEERLAELNEITDEQLSQYISCACTAMRKIKDVDYVVERNKSTNKLEVFIVDVENTGRVMYGSRWSHGLHEFVELKEGIPIKEQTYTVASICHPSFFEPYEEIYGLTGTLGEESERNEIFNIYHVDTFDVPPNRRCQRKRDKTLIVRTEKKKEEYILDTIRNMKNQGRPILIIVYSIEESERLSSLLRKQKIDHFILNDQQPQDEDFVVDHAGHPGAVTVATNTAGRGTDIHIEKSALRNGGLHTLITFWPANLRVECQALGRSARQGQPGSCQIIFASNKFGDDNIETSEETLKRVYEERTLKIEFDTQLRLSQFLKEEEIFEVLQQYFDYIRNLNTFLELPESMSILNTEYKGITPSYIIKELDENWAKFYTSLDTLKDEDTVSFDMFLDKWNFKKKYPSLCVHFDKWLTNQPDLFQSSPIASPTPSFDISSQLTSSMKMMKSMGIDESLCDDALSVSGNNISTAANLLFNASQKGSRRKDKSKDKEPKGNLAKLVSMGFDLESSKIALQQANDNIQIAVALLLNEEKNDSKQEIQNNNENENDNDEPEIRKMIEQLMKMGFDEKSCRFALEQSNYNLQEAANLLIDRNSMQEKQTNKNTKKVKKPEIEKLVDFLVSMGFDKTKSRQALIQCKNDVDKALDLLINNEEKSKENEEPNETSLNIIQNSINSKKNEKEKDIYQIDQSNTKDKSEELIMIPDKSEKIDSKLKSISICGLFTVLLLSAFIIGLIFLCFCFIKPSFYCSLAELITNKTIQCYNLIKTTSVNCYRFAKDKIPSLYSKIKKWIINCYHFIKVKIVYLYDTFKKWVINCYQTAKEKAPILCQKIKNWFANYYHFIKEKLQNIHLIAKDRLISFYQLLKQKIPALYLIIKDKVIYLYISVKMMILKCYHYLKYKIILFYQMVKNKIQQFNQ